jgi:pyochelin synthetase
MTSVRQLLAELEKRGIILFLADGEMRYRSPKDALIPADREALKARRSEIVAYLSARDAAKGLRAARGGPGPLMPSVVQEMWWRFAGAPEEGKPVALNIGMVGTFPDHDATAVTAAIRELMRRHEALRVFFTADGETLHAALKAVDDFEIGQEDMRGLGAEAAGAATQSAQAFCALLNPILGGWLTRAKVIALPQGAVAVLSSAHMIADAGTRNIVVEELRNILEGRATTPSVPYNDYSLAERDFLAGPQGAALIAHWRDWYAAQPTMTAPSDGAPLLWGCGTRIVRNFHIPRRVMNRARVLASELKVTPFLVGLTIFAIALARWSGRGDFPIRVLGDKRTAMDLTNTVGLMFCADAVAVHAPPDASFETVLRGIKLEYDAALSRRIPTLHFYAPQMVRPGIEPPGFSNRIPAVFNYYSVGTAHEKADKSGAPDASTDWPWPPQVTELPAAHWPRVSSPLFLHLMDYGSEAAASLHFYADVIGAADRDSFQAMLFAVFDEALPA